MKNRLYGLLALLAGILLLGTGCSDDESGRTLLAAKTNLTLAKYCNAEDGLTSVVWKKGEQAALVVERPGRTEPVFAEPILPGTERSLFLFNVTAPRDPVAVAAWWPADAQVTCEDGVLKTSIPAAQDGTVFPILLVGHTTGVVNSYEGVDMELSQARMHDVHPAHPEQLQGHTRRDRSQRRRNDRRRSVGPHDGLECHGFSAAGDRDARRSGRLRGRRSDTRRAAGACGSFVGLHGDLVRWRYGG